MEDQQNDVQHKIYRVKGQEAVTPFNSLQGRLVLYVDDLFAAENPDQLIVQFALQTASVLSEAWASAKDTLELVSEEGQ